MMPELSMILEERGGNAMIEFALAMALLFPILAGSFQLGHALYIQNEMQTAVRSGARYASLRTYDSPTSIPSPDYKLAVQNMTVYGDPAGGTVPVVPGMLPANVTVTVVFSAGVPKTVTVGVDEFHGDAELQMIDFETRPSASLPYVGRYAPE